MSDISENTLNPGDLHVEVAANLGPLDTARSIAAWGAALSFLAGSLAAFIALDRTVMRGDRFDAIGRWVCRRVTDIIGIDIERRGLEHLAPGGRYVFAVNHVSMLDLFVVFQSIPYFHRSFQDESHFDIPVYGHIIRVFGQVPVRRGDKAFNQRAFERAAEMLRGGDSFVVFPEGHRTRDGRLGPFFAGGFRLAKLAGVPVVPMAMRGLRAVNAAGEWRLRPGRVEVVFGEPIASDGDESAEEMAQRTRTALDKLLRDGTSIG